MRVTAFKAALFAAVMAPVALSSQDQTVRIRAAKALDGTGKVLSNVTITIQGSKITSIGPDNSGAATYNLGTLTAMPGMIDVHAHVGWLFIHTERGLKSRYAPDLLKDPIVSFINRTFVLWVAAGLIVPFFLGWAIGGSLATALTGLLWGGAVRMLVLHHATYSINSLCHFFGRRRFATDDESRNVWWLSFFTFGEAWHNNHHAFPTSARHGLSRWNFDPSAWVIWALEKTGLAWDVVRIPPERQAARLAT